MRPGEAAAPPPWLSVVIAGRGEQAVAASVRAQAAEGVELLTVEEVDRARGEYLWFVEPDAELPPGTLAQIREALRSTAPDVLLLHHGVQERPGSVREGPHRALLAAIARHGAVTLDERPGIAATAVREWDKIFRRTFLQRRGVHFVAGGHRAVTLTWPALVAAERIAAVPARTYLHRRTPEGSPFDVFAAYNAVFERIAAGPERRRALVPPAMLRHQLSLLSRVREADRRAYFRAVSESWTKHRTGAEAPPRRRVERLRRALVERDAYAASQALERSLNGRRGLARRRKAVARLRRRTVARVQSARMDRHYASRRRQPVDPQLAVYAAYWFRGYSCNPRAIYEKARELAPGVRGVWVVKASAADRIPEGVEHVVAGTREYFDLIARAKYFVNNVNFPNHLVKREGTVHVMTHHGTPLKRMGLDLRHAAAAGRGMDFAALLRRCERWDYSISSNAFSTQVWERVYPTDYETLEVGYPRNDLLATATDEEVAAARAELGLAAGQTAVLYAPTHREYQKDYVPMLDLGRVAEGLGSGHVLLARLHYFYDSDPRVRELHRAGRIRDVASHPSVERLCLAADVLVTDYSSIMFDYAVLNRPIVIHAPDWEEYRALRGTYFDLMAEPPGTVTRTEPELVAALADREAWGAAPAAARAAFRERFCSLEDGRASERVVRRVWLHDER